MVFMVHIKIIIGDGVRNIHIKGWKFIDIKPMRIRQSVKGVTC